MDEREIRVERRRERWKRGGVSWPVCAHPMDSQSLIASFISSPSWHQIESTYLLHIYLFYFFFRFGGEGGWPQYIAEWRYILFKHCLVESHSIHRTRTCVACTHIWCAVFYPLIYSFINKRCDSGWWTMIYLVGNRCFPTRYLSQNWEEQCRGTESNALFGCTWGWPINSTSMPWLTVPMTDEGVE